MRSLCAYAALLAAVGSRLEAQGGLQARSAVAMRSVPAGADQPDYRPLTAVREVALPLQRPVTLHLTGVPLEQALESIAGQAKLGISYGEALVRSRTRVSVDVAGGPAADALAASVRGTPWQVLATPGGDVTVVPRPAAARQGSVTGRVVDAASGAPVQEAQVGLVGTPYGARTNAQGVFTIANVPAGAYRVRVSRIGFTPKEQELRVADGPPTTVTVSLETLPQSLEGVVVVGYGTQRRRDVTGAVASITLPEETSAPTVTVEQVLQGRAAGVQVTQASGAPGGAVTVRVRGANSLSANAEPLYVIDGVPAFVGSTDPGSVTTGLSTNPLADINPNDIASIEVLKDASATAIYGSRGANGVVLISTKRGKAGENKFTLESSVGTQRPFLNGISLMPAQQYMRLYNEARANGALTPFFTDTDIANAVNNDWFDAVLRDAGVQNHSLSVAGGDDRTRYLVSGGVFDQKGIIVNSGFRRYSARLNLNRDVSQRFRIGNTLTLSRTIANAAVTDNAQGPQAGVIQGAMEYPTFVAIRDSLGNYSLNPFGSQANPVATALEITNDRFNSRALGNLFAEFDITSDLRVRSSVGGNASANRQKYYAPSITFQGAQFGGRAQVRATDANEFLNENTINFRRAVAQGHDVDLLGGFTMQTYRGDGVGAFANGFATDATGADNLGAGATPQPPSTTVDEWAILSYIGRANYNLLGRYLVTLTGRYDGSSRFGAGNKWGFFPSAALAWRVSDEPFMQGASWLSELKLRSSYGITGNQEIGTYASLAALRDVNYVYGGSTVIGYVPGARRANPLLKWESTRQFDVGFDLGLASNRVSLTADYYNSRTRDLLLSVAQASITGYDTQLRNVGSVKNWGVEMTLSTVNVTRERFSWNSSLNLSKNRNEVVDLGPLDEISGGNGKTSGFGQVANTTAVRVGQPIGAFLGYKVLGLWQAGESGAGFEPGEYKLQDTNGDGTITPEDRVIIGDPTPKFYGGFTNDLNFGPVSLSAAFQGSYGGKVANIGAIKVNRGIFANGGHLAGYDDYWTPTNTDAALPKPRLAGRNPRLTSDFVEDGSFLRLATVTVGYVLPRTIVPRSERTRLYLTGQNLWLLTNYEGFDPEVNSYGGDPLNRGIDIGSYPRARTFNLGINATF